MLRTQACLACALLLAPTGCSGGNSGSASVTDTIAGTTLSLNTTFGLVQTVYGLQSNGNYQQASAPVLYVFSTGATFDATQDQRSDSGTTLRQMVLDQGQNGWIELAFANPADIGTGTPYGFTNAGDECYVNFGTEPLQNSMTLAAPVVLGTKVSCSFTFTQIGTAVGGSFAGTLTYTIAAASSDPAVALTGTVTVNLAGPLVNQLLGASNIALLLSPSGGCSTTGCPEGLICGDGDTCVVEATADAGSNGDAGAGSSNTGSPCNANSACTGGDQCVTNWPQGYCSMTCTTSSDCGPGDVCGYVLGQNGCLVSCQSDQDCRSGYVCDPTSSGCVAACMSNADCDTGQTCDSTGHCD